MLSGLDPCFTSHNHCSGSQSRGSRSSPDCWPLPALTIPPIEQTSLIAWIPRGFLLSGRSFQDFFPVEGAIKSQAVMRPLATDGAYLEFVFNTILDLASFIGRSETAHTQRFFDGSRGLTAASLKHRSQPLSFSTIERETLYLSSQLGFLPSHFCVIVELVAMLTYFLRCRLSSSPITMCYCRGSSGSALRRS